MTEKARKVLMYVKLRSWHVVRLTRSIEARTLCGRRAKMGAVFSDDLPAEKSCESCLRIRERQAR